MAIVKGSVIGNLSGRLGNLSARTVDGKTILAARPANFIVSQDPAVVEIRQKFAVTVSFVKNLLNLSALYKIWKEEKPSGISVFNYAFKQNFVYSSAEKPSDENIITPGGFALPVQLATLGVDNLTLELPALNTVTIFTPEEVNLSANGLVCYYNPIDPEDKAYKIIKLNSEIDAYDFTQTFEVNIGLDVLQQAIAAKYQNSILFFVVASKNAGGEVVQYSATFTQNN